MLGFPAEMAIDAHGDDFHNLEAQVKGAGVWSCY